MKRFMRGRGGIRGVSQRTPYAPTPSTVVPYASTSSIVAPSAPTPSSVGPSALTPSNVAPSTEPCEEEQGETLNSGKTELSPNGHWFGKTDVVTAVSGSFQAHYNEPYNCWKEVPTTVRNHMFLEFQCSFTWKPEYATQVRREYEKKVALRLKDHTNKASIVLRHVDIDWMSSDVRDRFIKKREDDAFRKRSKWAKVNRLLGKTSGRFDPGHRQGSVSTIEYAERLVKDNKRVFPTAAQVYEVTHSVPVGEDEFMLATQKANTVMETYHKKLGEYQDAGIEKNPDDVYYEIVGGMKKGKVYGLGSASEMFYKAPSSSKRPKSSFTPSIFSQLSSELEACKKKMEKSQRMADESLKLAQSIQERSERNEANWLKERDDFHGAMLKMQQNILQMSQFIKHAYGTSFTLSFLKDPHEPSGGGAPCAI